MHVDIFPLGAVSLLTALAQLQLIEHFHLEVQSGCLVVGLVLPLSLLLIRVIVDLFRFLRSIPFFFTFLATKTGKDAALPDKGRLTHLLSMFQALEVRDFLVI